MYKRKYIWVTAAILLLGLCSFQHKNVVLAQCSCEYLDLKAHVSDTVVEPGDTIAFTIIAENKSDCLYDLSNGRLEVDLGVLGGKIYPELLITEIPSKEVRDISYFEHTIPDVAEGEYTVSIFFYIEEPSYVLISSPSSPSSSCIRRAVLTLEVRIGPKGTISVVSSPQSLKIDESGSIKVKIHNPTKKDITYTVNVSAPSAIKMTQSSYVLSVGKESSKELTINFTALEEGTHTVDFILSAEAKELDVASVIIKVEELEARIVPKGTISVVSSPPSRRIDESGSIKVKIHNPTKKDITYTVNVSAPSAIKMTQSSYVLSVGKESSKELTAYFTALKEGTYTVDFILSAEAKELNATSVVIKVEEPAAGVLDIVTAPSQTTQKETVNLELRVTNTSKKNIAYTVTASPSGGLSLSQTVWNISVAAGDSKSLIVSATAVGSDEQSIDFELSCEGRSLSKLSWNTTVEENATPFFPEENTTVYLFFGGAFIAALAGAFSLMKLMEAKPPGQTGSTTEHLARTSEKAGNSAEEKGDLNEAAKSYERAAEVWRKIDKVERAVEFYRKAAELRRRLGKVAEALKNEEKTAETYEEAGLKAQKMGQLEKAAAYLEKAADIWRKTGNVEKTLELYEKLVDMYEKLKNTAKAQEMREKTAEVCEKTARLAQELREVQSAAKYYEKAVRLWLNAGKTEKAIDLCRTSAALQGENNSVGRGTTAALYERAGDEAEREGILAKAGDFYEKAADLQRKTGNEKAAIGNEEKAATLYEMAGQEAIGTNQFERAENCYEKAVDLWRKAGNESKVKEVEGKTIELLELLAKKDSLEKEKYLRVEPQIQT